jgi:hypothetical protein
VGVGERLVAFRPSDIRNEESFALAMRVFITRRGNVQSSHNSLAFVLVQEERDRKHLSFFISTGAVAVAFGGLLSYRV